MMFSNSIHLRQYKFYKRTEMGVAETENIDELCKERVTVGREGWMVG
jgi:hypothetical protein